MSKFEEWFSQHLSDYALEIARHGADAGFPHITYTQDCVDLYDQFEDDIFEALNEEADMMGYDNIDQLTSTFRRADMLNEPNQRKNLLVWFMCERTASTWEDD